MEFGLIFAQVGSVCTAPNPFEWVAIIALVTGAGIASISTGAAGIALAMTIVEMISTGSSVPTIATAVSVHTATGVGSLEILTSIIISIKGILGC